MSRILIRDADLTPGTGRTVYGRVVPYSIAEEVNDGAGFYREMFAPGAFTRSIRERGSKIKLFIGHDRRKLPVGKAVELREEPDGVHAAFDIAETRDGDDALAAVRSGVVDSFSIGLRGIRHRIQDDVTVRTEAVLYEVSLVGIPAFVGAEIAGVRSNQFVISRAVAQARLDLFDW